MIHHKVSAKYKWFNVPWIERKKSPNRPHEDPFEGRRGESERRGSERGEEEREERKRERRGRVRGREGEGREKINTRIPIILLII
jgi:hypothetical protein